MAVVWELSEEGYYATIRGPSDEVQFHLSVEKYSERWDWAMWRPGQDERTATRGLADTAQEAMWAAELATI
jgi:hypothetical protein